MCRPFTLYRSASEVCLIVNDGADFLSLFLHPSRIPLRFRACHSSIWKETEFPRRLARSNLLDSRTLPSWMDLSPSCFRLGVGVEFGEVTM